MTWWAGFGVAALRAPGGKDMAGYGPMAKKGEKGEALYARALHLVQGEETVTLVAVDLMGMSTWMLHRIAIAAEVEEGRLVVAGTHTHTAPGRWYGAPFYDAFAHPLKLLNTFDEELADHLVSRIAIAVKAAITSARPARVGVGRALCWEAGANRSLEAFEQNAEAKEWPRALGVSQGVPRDVRSKAVDPRVTAITAHEGDALLGAFVTFGCHATALGVEQTTYHPDWPGYALARLAGTYGDTIAIAQGAAGDVSPLPPHVLESQKDPTGEQGAELAARRGEAIADAATEAIESSREVTGALHVASEPWQPPAPKKWAVGWALLGAAEDARSPFHRWPFKCLKEGKPGKWNESNPQSPKRVVKIARALRGFCHLSRYHRLHRIDLGDHRVFTVPGEPTATAAARIERALIAKHGGSASVIAYAADYAGYFTTAEEYRAQHYEGASTVYGRESTGSLIDQYGKMKGVAPAPCRPEAEEVGSELADALSEKAIGTFVDEDAWIVFRHSGEPAASFGGRDPIASPVHLGDDVWVVAFQGVPDPEKASLTIGKAGVAVAMQRG